jgi:hypothetical protein
MQVTLEETTRAFKDWRNTRSNISEKIPDKLWAMVKQLLPTHDNYLLRKTLGINNAQIKQAGIVDNNNDRIVIDGFAMAPIMSVNQTTEICELALHKDGKSLVVKLPPSQLQSCLSIMVHSL